MRRINISWVVYKVINTGPKFLFAAYITKWCYGFLRHGAVSKDFLFYWVTASLAASGKATLLYDFSFLKIALENATGEPFPICWFYPPTFLLILLPFSFLPHLVSLVMWLSITLLGFVLVMRRIAPHPSTIWLTLAFPATLVNLGYGQNGFLSAALLGGGLLLISDFPYMAGLLFGFLTYKPHLAILLPVALIAGRRWKSLFAFIFSSGLLISLSIIVFGFDAWVAFLNNIPLGRMFLEFGFQGYIVDWHKMTSIFSALLLAGCPKEVARIVQGVVMLTVIILITFAWLKKLSLAMKSSVLVLGTLLFTPYLFEYDLTLLALPIAWLGWEGHTKGWLTGERTLLIITWFTPLFSILFLKFVDLQITPLIVILMICLVLRRILSCETRERIA